MSANGLGEELQRAAALRDAGAGDGEEAGGGHLSLGALVAEAAFAPDDRMAQRAFGTVVGRFDAGMLDEHKQAVAMFE